MNTRIITTALAASILAIPAMADAPGYFKVPGTETTIKVYGRAQTWAWYNMNQYSNGADGYYSLDKDTGGIVWTPGENPMDQSNYEKGTVDSVVKGRFGITSTTPSAYGDVNVKIEVEAASSDANGNGAPVKLRHAYGEFAGLLIGQTTSLMYAWQYCPGYLDTWHADFWDPTYRTRQIRYTFAPTKEIQVAFSLEQDSTGGNSTKLGQVAVGAFQYSADWGNVVAAVGYQKKRNWSVTDSESGSGVSFNVGGSWNITPNDNIGLRYSQSGGNQGVMADGFTTDDDGDIAFYKSKALDLGYAHTWNDQFTTNVGVGLLKWDKDEDLGVYEDTKMTEFFLNTTWNVTKNCQFGAEYFHSIVKHEHDFFQKKNGSWTEKATQNGFNLMFTYNFF